MPDADLVIVVRGSVKKGLHTTYWPSVVDRGEAARLRLRVNEQKSGVVIRLGKPAPTRRVKVQVTRADGRPATDGLPRMFYEIFSRSDGFKLKQGCGW